MNDVPGRPAGFTNSRAKSTIAAMAAATMPTLLETWCRSMARPLWSAMARLRSTARTIETSTASAAMTSVQRTLW
jgi:hypothetical protein